MAIGFYRFVSHHGEAAQLQAERKVLSTNPAAGHATWYTPTRYDDPVTASDQLALPSPPSHRIGPIPADEMPTFDIGLRTVAPAFGKPGGGIEARTRSPVWLPGLWNFGARRWDL